MHSAFIYTAEHHTAILENMLSNYPYLEKKKIKTLVKNQSKESS